MTQYVPILKGKPGEFVAWQNAAQAVLDGTRPIFEVAPSKGTEADLTKFVSDAATHWPEKRVLTFDTSALDHAPVDTSGARPLLQMAQMLSDRGVPARPVVHLDDEPATLADAGTAASIHGVGICVRLGSEEQDPDAATTSREMPNVLNATGLNRGDVDVVIDLRFIDSPRTVGRVRPVAEELVRWCASNGPWRSITVASGAFPSSISHLPTRTYNALPRLDADLWTQLDGLPVVPDFGDYGVANPGMPAAVPRGPLPNLRYTQGQEWWVWRENRDLPGNESFRTLCGRVVQSAAWPQADFCWGDAEIERCSRSEGGPGTATQWRAYGTSHHLATVIDRLATLDAP